MVLPAIEPGQLSNIWYLSAVLVDHAPPSWLVNDVAGLGTVEHGLGLGLG